MNILIAEDDSVSAMALEIMLKRQGHAVTVASNGAKAWHLFQEGSYPIVITDWMMPEMDGLEFCRRIRGHAKASYTCVVMLTAKQAKEDKKQALNAGVDVFLTKPICPEDMVARLQVAMRILEMEKSAA